MWWKKLLSLFMLFLITCSVLRGAQEAVKNLLPDASARPETKKFNVFVVFSENIEQQARTVSQALKDQEGLDTFPQLGFQIHCTLYMTRYAPEKADDLKAFVASLSRSIRAFPAKTTELHQTKDNWFFLNIDRDRNLQNLCDTVVRALAPWRAPSDQVPDWLNSYPEKMEFFKEFGSPNVFSQFEPHLTLLSRSDGEKLTRFMAKNAGDKTISGSVSGTAFGLGLAEADGAGQMKEGITIFPFTP